MPLCRDRLRQCRRRRPLRRVTLPPQLNTQIRTGLCHRLHQIDILQPLQTSEPMAQFTPRCRRSPSFRTNHERPAPWHISSCLMTGRNLHLFRHRYMMIRNTLTVARAQTMNRNYIEGLLYRRLARSKKRMNRATISPASPVSSLPARSPH
jgi:hypothetical protein